MNPRATLPHLFLSSLHPSLLPHPSQPTLPPCSHHHPLGSGQRLQQSASGHHQVRQLIRLPFDEPHSNHSHLIIIIDPLYSRCSVYHPYLRRTVPRRACSPRRTRLSSSNGTYHVNRRSWHSNPHPRPIRPDRSRTPSYLIYLLAAASQAYNLSISPILSTRAREQFG